MVKETQNLCVCGGGESDSITGSINSLHKAEMDLITSTSYCLLDPPIVIIEHRIRSRPWKLMGVGLKQNKQAS